jgi:hypothetical protein
LSTPSNDIEADLAEVYGYVNRSPPDGELGGFVDANSYNQDTRNLRYGHANDPQFDPLAGTVFDGVAPY